MALSITHPYVSAVADDGDVNKVQPTDWNAAHTVSGTLAGSSLETPLTLILDDATNNGVSTVLTLAHTSSGAPAAGIGAGLNFTVETAAGNNEIGAAIQAIASDVTATSEDFYVSFKTMAAGAAAAERVRIGHELTGTVGNAGSGTLRLTDVGGDVLISSYSGVLIASNAAGTINCRLGPSDMSLPAGGVFGFSSSNSGPISTGSDTVLTRDAAGIFAMRNGATAHSLRVYNAHTNSTNYERIRLGFSSNIGYLGFEKDGTGSSRYFIVEGDGGTQQIRFGTGEVDHLISGNIIFRHMSGYSMVASNVIRGWSNSATSAAHDNIDTGLYRNAAGVVEVNSGVAGTYRDLIVRKHMTPITSELTIATGAVTATGGYHLIDTEADAASDDLDTINGGSDGQLLVIRAADSARSVVVKDGTGNIQCAGDFTMDNAQDTMTLFYVGALTAWLEISRSDNGA